MSTCRDDYCNIERAALDRRRLEEGHLKYCSLDVIQRYSTFFSSNTIKKDFQETLENLAPIYYKAYAAKYACKCQISTKACWGHNNYG